MAGKSHENGANPGASPGANPGASPGASLPFAALQLLAPPVRLVSAALWKVIKQRDVMHYGVLEEFVTSACETVPGLLTVRHQGKLALGLRGRLILELCRKQPDEEAAIMSQLERIRVPAAMSASAHLQKKDVKIHRTVEDFHSLVRTLLTDVAARERFFKEEFPVDYGLKFDQELQNLLWEFLIRLDQLLPVPSLTRTVSWLSEAPPVLEECARAATQPQLLKILLQHQMCLGHLEAAASLPPNMGDSILDSLSLPPSGRAASKEPTGSKMADAGPSDDTQTQTETPFITPVIGIISNDDAPVMSAKKRVDGGGGGAEVGAGKAGGEQPDKRKAAKPRGGVKRKQPDRSESDEEAEVDSKVRSEEQGTGRSLGSGASAIKPEKDSEQATNVLKTEDSRREDQGGKRQDLSVHFASCLNRQPVVLLDALPVSPDGMTESGGASESPRTQWQPHRRRKPSGKPDSTFPASDNKENRPSLASTSSSSWQRSNAETLGLSGDGEDYVADSEDEATKNFKDRLFMKRYCRTKHGTYVPTLREHFRPRMARRDLLWTGSKRR